MIDIIVFVSMLCAACSWSVHGEDRAGRLFYSTSRLQTFLSLNVSNGLDRYIDHERKRLEIIKTAKGYEEEVPQVITRLEKLRILSQELRARAVQREDVTRRLNDFHPTTTLRHVSDFVNTWVDKMANESVYGFRLPEFLSNKQGGLPSRDDLEGMAEAVAELQFVYNLSTSDIYAGRIMGHQGASLAPHDAFAVGCRSKSLGLLRQAAAWFAKALAETPDHEKTTGNAAYSVPKAIAYLGVIKYSTDEVSEGLSLMEKASELDTEDDEIVKLYLSHRHGRDIHRLKEAPTEAKMAHWLQLCQNASRSQNSTVLLNGPAKWYHVCRYRKAHAVPYKVYREEILSRSPHLSLLHQVVSDAEADELINVALKKQLQQKSVPGAEGLLHFVEGTSVMNNIEIAATLSARLSEVTGLDTTERFPHHSSGEPFHVLNYGLAGTFFPHLDVNMRYKSTYLMNHSGERMASLIIYLSDVISGGATAFNLLNITVIPRKGNALLLYNLGASGDREEDAEHTGCPVAVGAKWVASKGVWSWGNELRHPCGKRKTSSHLEVDKMLQRLRI